MRNLAFACLLLATPISVAGKDVRSPENAPICQDVSLFVVPLKSTQIDYRFRLMVHNDSAQPIVLAPLLPTNWELERYGAHGWRSAGGGGLGPGWAVDSDGRYPNEQYIHVLPGGTFTKVFDRPDLFGDGGSPAPGVPYRVLFTYWYEPSAGETHLVLLPCAIHANPAQFTGPPPD